MRISTVDSLAGVPAAQWDALQGPDHNPFLRHTFLAGLEHHGCVGERWGWLPRHLLAWDGDRLRGALPLYLKDNSYGELVFDWSWADAYQRAGLAYYPKLVSAVPYTPAGGPRLLLASDAPADLPGRLIEEALEQTRTLGCSSLHVLFPDETQCRTLQGAGLLRRTGTQFHWFNRGYRDFDDFLDRFTAEKRKKLRRERRRVVEQGVTLEVLEGRAIDERHWAAFHRFYAATFDKRGGYATLTEAFFQSLGRDMPDQVVLVLARHGGRYVAGALSFRSHDALYGRHWGCEAEFNSLHFEACYYAGLDYCIEHGLQRFEPGAQGEHKVARGFEPVPTWSAHWLAHRGFSEAVAKYLAHEQEATEEYMRELADHLPFKKT
ncbi:MAG: GNAT family N-acetyltransferase [Gammaproteobacteria bacterium]|nr:GNAT family N-acetyltransferase [Gammaproteobacteria bacterium]